MSKWSTAKKLVLLCLLAAVLVLVVAAVWFISHISNPSLAFSDALSASISAKYSLVVLTNFFIKESTGDDL